jgi:hypothetical protein
MVGAMLLADVMNITYYLKVSIGFIVSKAYIMQQPNSG